MGNGTGPDWSRPPVQGQRQQNQHLSGLDRLIPTKNGYALAAYYTGVFSLIPCAAFVLAPLALIFGALGLKAIKRSPGLPGTGHAIAGIVMGSITFIANTIAVIWLIANSTVG